VSKYNQTDADVERMLSQWDPYDFSLIENYYMVNRCFLDEGQLLRNAGRLADIPTFIVNGRYDMPCPPITAWRIHKAIPKSELYIIETANHSGSEPETRSKLIEITRRLGQ
jgi:proline iminopeptidase